MSAGNGTNVLAPGLDKALRAGSARKNDLLDRWEFARQAVHALRYVSPEAGYTISIEGPWGSGKTSTLAMIEDAYAELESPTPVFVPFNPWIIGSKEALLRQFFATLSTELKLSTGGKSNEVADAIDKYSAVFDYVKHVPLVGWKATAAKGVLWLLSKVFKAFGKKGLDIEASKRHVAKQLKLYPRKIIVLFDDIDRLYPAEVFEVIRIIKAVADLPNVGYVLAMDATYVSEALKHLGVPHSSSYLDKVIQARLQIPVLSSAAKLRLINRGFSSLPEAARELYFPRTESLLATLYNYGLKDVLERPRDFARLFNVVETIEPALREEVVLADIIAWAALVTKAPSVAELFRRSPEAAIGRMPGDVFTSEKSEDIVAGFEEKRQLAYQQCDSPNAAREIVEFLFPMTARSRMHSGSASWRDGRLAHPSRLVIALQLAVTSDDVSFRLIQRFIKRPDERKFIGEGLTFSNCSTFVETLGDAAVLSPLKPDAIVSLCCDIARLVDLPVFADPQRQRGILMSSPVVVALRAVERVSHSLPESVAREIARSVVIDPAALSFAAIIVAYEKSNEQGSGEYRVVLDTADDQAVIAFGDNVLEAARQGTLFDMSEPREILKAISLKAAERGPEIFSVIKAREPNLGRFITTVMKGAFDSTKGQIFSRPRDETQLTAFVALPDLIEFARTQLAASSTQNPERVAWQALVENRSLYARDGSDPRDF